MINKKFGYGYLTIIILLNLFFLLYALSGTPWADLLLFIANVPLIIHTIIFANHFFKNTYSSSKAYKANAYICGAIFGILAIIYFIGFIQGMSLNLLLISMGMALLAIFNFVF